MENKKDASLIWLTGLELAKYILLRLVDNHESIKQISKDFDDDIRFVNSIIKFLKDIKWIEQYGTGFQMTDAIRMKVNSSEAIV